jgi:hypothetical protein
MTNTTKTKIIFFQANVHQKKKNHEETKDEICRVKETFTKPIKLDCWDNKAVLKYHPDRNTGCFKRANNMFQIYQSFHDKHNEAKDNLFPSKCP